ncbi:hypothetical protein [Nafulsella turpanensis]|uniref:hypothetical protein n=1 Tax=Nafulsella turpanensis TaxID=1265690 RepID=UPI00034B86D0|nr:hypothetical protein [Nafulsella turpanensis]
MTDCIVLIQIKETAVEDNPEPQLLRKLQQDLPDLTTFHFDNFSEESIRLYALDLIRQSRKVAIVVQLKTTEGPTSGIEQFFKQLQALKHPQVLFVQEGIVETEAALHRVMQQIGGPQFEEAATDLETTQYILKFLQSP